MMNRRAFVTGLGTLCRLSSQQSELRAAVAALDDVLRPEPARTEQGTTKAMKPRSG